MRGYTLTGLISLLVLEVALVPPSPSFHLAVQDSEIHVINPPPTPAPYRGSGRRTTALLMDSDLQ
jgi:hypothetical protein